jgi:hypothetical protein
MSITRFIILAHARSGSSILMLSLRQHPAISMLGEVFHQSGEYWKVGDYAPGAGLSAAPDGGRFLENYVFRPPNEPQTRAIGFKILYLQARSGPEASAWSFLQKNADIRIIHLYRTNLLETVVSLQLALRSGEWYQTSGAQTDTPLPISLDPTSTKDFFEHMRAQRRWAADAFRRHRLLAVDYDLDLKARFQQTLETAQSFLQVPVHRTVPRLQKQAQAPMSEQIANYAELRRYFAKTHYEVFFDG